MTFDELIKYVIWAVFLGIAVLGLVTLLKNIGVLG